MSETANASMSCGSLDVDFTQPIAIFPLPNTVLLPRAIVPLHMFEPRYREMAQDVADGHGLVAMALLKPGYEAKYYTHHAAIHPVVCLGRILRHERLDDGRYNLLLQGLCRAKIRREDRARSYRRGWLSAVLPVGGLAADGARQIRARLSAALDSRTLAALSPTGVLRDVVNCPDLPLSDMLDLLAFDLVDSPAGRLRFLEQPDVKQRAAWLDDLLAAVRTRAVKPATPAKVRSRFQSDN